MKMKQKLAATLAGVMALSMVPATSAFAASTTVVTNQFIKSSGYGGVIESSFRIETTTPLKAGEVITFVIDNDAESGDKSTIASGDFKKLNNYDNVSVSGVTYKLDNTVMQIEVGDDAAAKKLNDAAGRGLVVSKDDDGNNVYEKYVYTVPYKIDLNKKAGDVKVTISSTSSKGATITEDVVKVATIVGTSLTATILSGTNPVLDGATKKDSDYVVVKNITITEALEGSMPSETYDYKDDDDVKKTARTKWFKLSVDNPDFTWVDMNYINDEELGLVDTKLIDATDVLKGNVTGILGFSDRLATDKTKVYVANGGSDLYIGVELTKASTSVGAIRLSGLKLYKAEDADYSGKVNVTISAGRDNGYCGATLNGDMTVTAIKEDNIAKADKEYGQNTDFAMDKAKLKVATATFTVVDDVEPAVSATSKTTNLVAGALRNISFDSSTLKSGKMTITETTVGAIVDTIEIEVPEGVKIIGVHTSKEDNINGGATDLALYNGKKLLGNVDVAKNVIFEEKTIENAVTKIAYEPKADRTGKVKIEVELLLSISGDYEGDTVEATVTTRYGESKEHYEEDVTIAKVSRSISATQEVSYLDNNTKKQDIEDIVITETKAGALASLGYIELKLEEGMLFSASDKEVEVVEGDIKISAVERDGDTIKVRVNKPSTQPSTIKFTGLQVTTKNIADGVYDIRVSGSAISANDIYSIANTDNVSALYRIAAINEDYDNSAALKTAMEKGDFVIDEKNDDKIADKSVRYFNAGSIVLSTLAVGDVDVTKPAEKVETQLVTLKTGDLTYKRADGTTGTMVAAPYFNYVAEGAVTMVPIRAVGEILGATFEWSDATKTATFIMPDGRYGQVTLGSAVARSVDGSQYTMRWAAETSKEADGAMFVPVRDVARILGFEDGTVDYDYTNKCVSIIAPIYK